MLLSTGLVFVGYSAYSTLAVPLIEPAAPPAPVAANIELPSDSSNIDEINQRKLAPYFAEDSWERTGRPKVLMTEKAIFVIKDHRTLDGDKVELTPFSMVILPTKKPGQETAPGRATIIQAPDGAVLEFDEPFDLKHIKSPHLIGGTLRGEINIYSQGTELGAKDDLRFVTRDIELRDDSISTPHEVKFQFGQSRGTAKDLEIKLKLSTEAGRRRGEIEGIQSFELRKNVHLEFVSANMVPGGNNADAPATPITVASRGPFRFDMTELTAMFTDQVDVVHLNADGPGDQLRAEALLIHFARRLDKLGGHAGGSFDLEPQIVEATGDPVVIDAPSQSAHARCQRLEYNLINKRVVLEGSEDVVMQDRMNEIQTHKRLVYTPGAPGELATVTAKGPGHMQGTMPGERGDRYQVSWGDDLKLLPPSPDEPNHVLALTGGAKVSVATVGNLGANNMYFYLTPTSSPPVVADKKDGAFVPKMPDAQITKMQALGEVLIDSPQLHGDVKRLMAWFERQPGKMNRPPAANVGNAAAAVPNGKPLAANGGAAAPQPGKQSPPKPSDQYVVHGGELRLKFITRGQQQDLSEVKLSENVTVQRGQNGEMHELKPLNIDADSLTATRLDTPTATVEAQGHPAVIDAQGMRLSGNQIKIDQAENQMWINGPGRLQLPMARDLNGQQLANPQVLKTIWTDGLEFNGRKAEFKGNVVAQTEEQRLEADVLAVELTRSVDFSGAQHGNAAGMSPEVKIIDARKRVLIENQSHDPITGKLTSQDSLSLQYVTVNQQTGDISGQGPGHVISVRKDMPLGAMNMPGDNRGKPTAPRPPANPDALTFIRVDFENGLKGKMGRDYNEVKLDDRVKAVVGPVNRWEDVLPLDNPDGLGESGMLLSSDSLKIITSPTRPGQKRSDAELIAEGATKVEGQSFSAQANRLSYATAKQLLILEGDMRSKARIAYRKPGSRQDEKGEGRVIKYHTDTRDIAIEGGGSFDFNSLTTPGR
jgi:lipopolysaccharide export system protein LptA